MPRYRPDQASCGRQGTFPPKRLLWPSHQAVLFDTRRPCVIKVGEFENAQISAGSSFLWPAGHFPAKKIVVAESPGSFVWYSQTLCYQGRRVRKCPDIGRIKHPVDGRAFYRQKDCCGRVTRQFCLILADLVLSRPANQKMPWYWPDQASCGKQIGFPAKKVAVAQLTSSFVWYFQTLCDRGKSDRICPDLRRLKQLIVGGNIFFNFLRNSCFILLVFQNDFTKFYFSFAFILAFLIFLNRGISFLWLSSWFFLQHYTSGWSPSNLQKIRGLWFLRDLFKKTKVLLAYCSCHWAAFPMVRYEEARTMHHTWCCCLAQWIRWAMVEQCRPTNNNNNNNTNNNKKTKNN